VPTQLQRLLASPAPWATPLAGFLLGAAGRGPAPADLLDAARTLAYRWWTTYGMSETAAAACTTGVPRDGVRAEVRDDGRIWISGPVLFSAPAAREHRRRLVPHRHWGGWTPGAAGRARPGDDVINTGGHKVVPGEVAAALQAAGRPDVAVVGNPTRNGADGSSRWWCRGSGRPAGPGIAP